MKTKTDIKVKFRTVCWIPRHLVEKLSKKLGVEEKSTGDIVAEFMQLECLRNFDEVLEWFKSRNYRRVWEDRRGLWLNDVTVLDYLASLIGVPRNTILKYAYRYVLEKLDERQSS